MLMKHFMRIPGFADVPPQELRALAGRSHVLCMPGRRWLVQEGKHIDAYFYLLKGGIETLNPRRKWRARAFGRLSHFYPGCSAVRTINNVQVLRVDAAHREFVLRGCSLPAASAAGAEPWLQKFLSSHMMQQLTPHQWQRLMSAFKAYDLPAGSRILVQGQPGRHCFVLEAGHALVCQAGATLCHLCPGDFFGEDALILGSVRNADVRALQAVRIHAIDKDVFARVLVDNLVQFVDYAGQGRCLCLGEVDSMQTYALANIRERAKSLDPRCTYYVRGGSRRERALAALLLVQRGIRAYPLQS